MNIYRAAQCSDSDYEKERRRTRRRRRRRRRTRRRKEEEDEEEEVELVSVYENSCTNIWNKNKNSKITEEWLEKWENVKKYMNKCTLINVWYDQFQYIVANQEIIRIY